MYRTRTAVSLIAALIAISAFTGPAMAAGTLDRIRQSGKLMLGYRADAQPFSYRDDSGNAAGYSVALCQAIADGLKADLGLANLSIEWVPVTIDDRFSAVQQGKVDLLCGAETETLSRRKEVAFSLPIYPSGIGALLAADTLVGAGGSSGEGLASCSADLAWITGADRAREADLLGGCEHQIRRLAARARRCFRNRRQDRSGRQL